MQWFKGLLTLSSLVLFSFTSPAHCFAEDMFMEPRSVHDKAFLRQISRIEEKIHTDFSDINFTVVDYLISNPNEIFLHTEDGLFYANTKKNTIKIEKLFSRSLGQILPEFSYPSRHGKFIIFKNENMMKGVITDWYSYLLIKPSKPFTAKDFGKIQGFDRISEDVDNFLDAGENVTNVKPVDLDNDGELEILFTITDHDYKQNTSKEAFRAFKYSDGTFDEITDFPTIQK